MALKVAVVGCGYWGPNLVRNFVSTPGIEVAWVCDLDRARLDEIARRIRVGRITTDVQEVFHYPTVDAVAVATPVATHRSLGEAALRAGKHLWVEKPLAGTVEDVSSGCAASATSAAIRARLRPPRLAPLQCAHGGRDRRLEVSVRVGSYELDNSGAPEMFDFEAAESGYQAGREAPLDDDATAQPSNPPLRRSR